MRNVNDLHVNIIIVIFSMLTILLPSYAQSKRFTVCTGYARFDNLYNEFEKLKYKILYFANYI